jgi:prepilin-type processing-associated H-X9-DG protein
VAIIGILASILFPVFSRVRENARRTSCQSNLKQIALGVHQYVQDYDSKFPCQITGVGTSTTGGPTVGWADALQIYLKSLQIYQCPSEIYPRQVVADNPGNQQYTDYYINAALGNTATAVNATPIYNNGGITEASVQNPTLTILNGDGGVNIGTAQTTHSTARFRVNGYTATGTSTTDTGAPALAASTSGPFGGFVSTAFIIQRHMEGSNFSFVDGHVKWYPVGTGTVKAAIFKDGTDFDVSLKSPTFNAKW